MACVDVSEWNPEQVAEWMRGLDDALIPYGHFFLNNAINGRHLLLLAADDLTNLQITKLGHQELILEGVELLRQFHYSLSTENLQSLSLKLSSKAHSLFNDLKSHSSEIDADGKQERVTAPVLSTVADVLGSVKALVSWLDRSPFEGQEQYAVIRNLLLHISIELATNALRDRFAERPIDVIKSCSQRLSDICDNVIKESKDPLVIQPASLDVATIKKKPDDELGMYIRSSYSGIHHIGQVKYQSPAHLCGRVEEGDEVVQVNYQTVVGWQLKKLVMIMRENPTEIILTLKKRPRHANMYGQTFLRSFTFSSKKHSSYFDRIEWPRQVSPQFDVCIGPSNQQNSTKTQPEEEEEEEEEEDDSAFLAEAPEISSPSSIVNFFIPRPRSAVQRRATVTGASPQSTRPPISIDQLWRQVKREQVMRSMSHDPSKFLSERPDVATEVRRLKESTPTHKEEDVENEGGAANMCEVQPLTKERNPKSPPRSALRPQTCIGTDPLTEYKVKLQNNSVGDKGTLEAATKEKTMVFQKSASQKETARRLAADQKLTSNSLPRTLTPNNSGFSSSDTPPTVPSVIITTSDSSTSSSSTKSVSQNETKTPVPLRKDSHPLREMLRDLDNALRTSLQNLVGDNIQKAKSLDQEVEKIENVQVDVVSTASPSPSTSSLTNSKDEQPQKSYQVIIAGGVPQVSTAVRKDSTKSPKQSPVLRRKAKAWEFANRRVSCKDLGMGDCQGWLHKRKEHTGLLTGQRWAKRWCVLKNHNFYCYKDINDLKAESLMYLPGFSVSPASEMKTKKHAFKVYHSGAAFYYASDTQQDMSKWMNKMGLAAIAYDATAAVTTSGFVRPMRTFGVENLYYSETEDDGEEVESVQGNKESTTSITLSTANSLMSVDSALESSSLKTDNTIAPSNSCPNFTPPSHSEAESRNWKPPTPCEPNNSPKSCRNANTLPKYSPVTVRRMSGPQSFTKSESSEQTQVSLGESACYQPVASQSSLSLRETRNKSADAVLMATRSNEIHRNKRKGSSSSVKGIFREKLPVSVNISSIIIGSIRTSASTSSSPISSPTKGNEQEGCRIPRSGGSLKLDGKIAPNKRIPTYAERRYTKFGSTDSVHLDKPPPPITMAPAFEMNLDSQPPLDPSSGNRRQSENSNRFSRTALQLVRSPNILKKFATSPRSDNKRPSRTTMWFDQEIDFSPGSSSTVSSEEALDSYPKYATCGSQTELRCLTRGKEYANSSRLEPRNFSTWQRDKHLGRASEPVPQRKKAATWDTRYSRAQDVVWEQRRVESLTSAWRQVPTTGREAHYKTKVTVRISDINEKSSDESESPRLPLKPAMGVAMIGKQRRTSNVSDKTTEPRSPIPGSPLLASQGTQTDTDDEDDLAILCDNLHHAQLSIDGTRVDIRRKNTMLSPHANKRQSQQLLLLRALHRTLKARQQELDAINDLLSFEVTAERFREWLEIYSGICLPLDQSSSELNESD